MFLSCYYGETCILPVLECIQRHQMKLQHRQCSAMRIPQHTEGNHKVKVRCWEQRKRHTGIYDTQWFLSDTEKASTFFINSFNYNPDSQQRVPKYRKLSQVGILHSYTRGTFIVSYHDSMMKQRINIIEVTVQITYLHNLWISLWCYDLSVSVCFMTACYFVVPHPSWAEETREQQWLYPSNSRLIIKDYVQLK